MFKPREDKDDVTKVVSEPPKTLVTACKQIVDCLVRHILVLEEDGQNATGPQPRTTTQRILACHKTLYLFAKIRPQLLVDHAITLQPYLAWRCQVKNTHDCDILPDEPEEFSCYSRRKRVYM